MAFEENPHPEEAAQRPSRRAHGADPSLHPEHLHHFVAEANNDFHRDAAGLRLRDNDLQYYLQVDLQYYIQVSHGEKSLSMGPKIATGCFEIVGIA